MSVGGFIAYLLSIGYKTIEIMGYIIETDFSKGLDTIQLMNLIKSFGAFSYEHLEKHTKKLTQEKLVYLPNLKQLYMLTGKTLIFTTVNRSKCKLEYLSYMNYPELDILTALRMTSNIPIVFEKCYYNGDIYLDGAIGNDFPGKYLDELLPLNENILGLLIKQELNKEDENLLTYIESIIQLVSILHDEQSVNNFSKRFSTITLHVEKGTIFNFKMTAKTKINYFLNGYRTTKQEIEEKTINNELTNSIA